MSEAEITPAEENAAIPLLEPRTSFGSLIDTNEGLLNVIDQLAQGSGPIAIDAERASGYKYSQRAYLVQIFRRGGGLHLIDPIGADNPDVWAKLSKAFENEEWIIHASTQDLPCLTELGLYPQILFDTELGGRIAGCPRVGLGPLAESLLNFSLAKEHSAVDWSKRPLNSEWLIYAALDVDVLVDLRDEVYRLLESQGKLRWAQQDFAQILTNYQSGMEKQIRKDPWRRTSGIHKVKDRRTLAIIRALWIARDEYAAKVDIAPGRIFNDEALVAAAVAKPKTLDEMRRILTKRTRAQNLPLTDWFEAIRLALQLPQEELPDLKIKSTTLPPPKIWRDRNPLGYARLTHARAVVAEKARELEIPVENLLSPEALRKLCWPHPPENFDVSYIEATLSESGARPWQIGETATILLEPLLQTEPLVVPEPDSQSDPSGQVSGDASGE